MSEIIMQDFDELRFNPFDRKLYYKKENTIASGVFYTTDDTSIIYIMDGKFHRENGPAFKHKLGIEYYYHGTFIDVMNDEYFQKQIRLLCLK